MIRYWVQIRDQRFVKGYGFSKLMGKNIGKKYM